MRTLSLGTALCMALLFCAPVHSKKWFQPTQWAGKVTRISDGDTLWIEALPSNHLNNTANHTSNSKYKTPVAAGQTRKVRVEGIDAPEICQPYGKTAKAALQNKLLNKTVAVATRSLDDYGRDIAQIKYQNEDIGAWMVAQGHAWSYHARHSKGLYAKEEQTAKTEQRGLFAQASPTEPRQFRQKHGSCFVRYKKK